MVHYLCIKALLTRILEAVDKISAIVRFGLDGGDTFRQASIALLNAMGADGVNW